MALLINNIHSLRYLNYPEYYPKKCRNKINQSNQSIVIKNIINKYLETNINTQIKTQIKTKYQNPLYKKKIKLINYNFLDYMHDNLLDYMHDKGNNKILIDDIGYYSGIILKNTNIDNIININIEIGNCTVFSGNLFYLKKHNLLIQENENKENNELIIKFPFAVYKSDIMHTYIFIKTKTYVKLNYELIKIKKNNINFITDSRTNIKMQEFTDYMMIFMKNIKNDTFARLFHKKIYAYALDDISTVDINGSIIKLKKKELIELKESQESQEFKNHINIKIETNLGILIYSELQNYYIINNNLSGIKINVDKLNSEFIKNDFLIPFENRINKIPIKINKKMSIDDKYIYTNYKFNKNTKYKYSKGNKLIYKWNRNLDLNFKFNKMHYTVDKDTVIITQFGSCMSKGSVVIKNKDSSTQTIKIGGDSNQETKQNTIKDDNRDNNAVLVEIKNTDSDKHAEDFYAYKMCKWGAMDVIVKLFIEKTAKVAKIFEETKMRTNRALVVNMWKIDQNNFIEMNCSEQEQTPVVSLHDPTFKYIKNNIVEPTEEFNPQLTTVCVSGIHFFLKPEQALKYIGIPIENKNFTDILNYKLFLDLDLDLDLDM